MVASVRVIKIMKDKNPMTGEEYDDYTLEFECIAEDSSKLAQELSKCPLGERVMDLIERAKFIPEGSKLTSEELKQEAEEEARATAEREEELREEGRKEVRKKYIKYIKKKRNIKDKDEEESEKNEEAGDHERDERYQDDDDVGGSGLVPPPYGLFHR